MSLHPPHGVASTKLLLYAGPYPHAALRLHEVSHSGAPAELIQISASISAGCSPGAQVHPVNKMTAPPVRKCNAQFTMHNSRCTIHDAQFTMCEGNERPIAGSEGWMREARGNGHPYWIPSPRANYGLPATRTRCALRRTVALDRWNVLSSL